MEQLKGCFAMITNPAVLAYILKGVAFTVIISVVAVLFGIVFGSVLAMVRNYCNSKKTRLFKWSSITSESFTDPSLGKCCKASS